MPGEPKTIVRIYFQEGEPSPEVQVFATGLSVGDVMAIQGACVYAMRILSELIPIRSISKDDQNDAKRLLDDGPK